MMKFVHRNGSVSIILLSLLLLPGIYTLFPNSNGPIIPVSSSTTQAPCPSCVTEGEWSAVQVNWPIAPIHMHVLPNGKVLSWSRDKDEGTIPCPSGWTDQQCEERMCVNRVSNKCPLIYTNQKCQNMGCVNRICDRHGYTKTYIWDPSQPGVFTQVDNTQTNLFCSGHTFLSDGQLLVTGGHKLKDSDPENHTNVFDFSTNSWFRPENSDMNLGRWYPTNTALGNGDVLVIGGDYNINPNITEPATPERNPLPQIWKTSLPQPPSEVYHDLMDAQLKIPFY